MLRLRLLLLATMATMAMMLGAASSALAITPPPYDYDMGSQARCVADLKAAGTYVPGYRCGTKVSDLGYYKGWASIRDGAYCVPQLRASAWRWDGTWHREYIVSNTRVYVWPFATGWSWVWTQAGGWRAVRDANLIVNKWDDPMSPRPMCAAPAGFTNVD